MDRAENYPYRQLRDELRYHLIRERLKWHTITDPQSALADYKQILAQGRYRDKSAAQYGYALALHSAGRLSDASTSMLKLIKQHPNVPELQISQAYIDAEQRQVTKGLQRLQRVLEQNPNSYAAYLAYGDIALGHKRYQMALQKLQHALPLMQDKPRLYDLLSRAAGNLKKKAQAKQYMAEKYALDGDYPAAILQLENALKEPKLDFYQSTRIESRLQALRLLRDEQEADR